MVISLHKNSEKSISCQSPLQKDLLNQNTVLSLQNKHSTQTNNIYAIPQENFLHGIKITDRLYDDHFNRILTHKTPKGKTEIYTTAVKVFQYLHNILRNPKNPKNIAYICYKYIANKLKRCVKTISNAIKYLSNIGIVTVKQTRVSIQGKCKTNTCVSISYESLIKLYQQHNIKTPNTINYETSLNDKTIDTFSTQINQKSDGSTKCQELPQNKENQEDFFVSTGGSFFPLLYNNNINNRSIKNNDLKNFDETNIKNTKTNSQPKIQKPQTKKSLIEFLPKQNEIFEAIKERNQGEIKLEDVTNTINTLINKYNPTFYHENQVIEYLSKTIKSQQSKCKKDLERDKPDQWASKRSIRDITITEQMLEEINKRSKKDFNLIAANKILDKLKSNEKYNNRTFPNNEAFLRYMTIIFVNEKLDSEYLGRTKEEQEQWDRVENIKENPATTNDKAIIKRLAYTLDNEKMCQVLDEAKIEYNDQQKVCNIWLKNKDSTLQHDQHFQGKLLETLQSMFTYNGDGLGFRIEFRDSESRKNYITATTPALARKQVYISDKLKSDGYSEYENKNKSIFDFIKEQIGENDFNSWCKDLKILISDDILDVKIASSSSLIHKWIKTNYIDVITDAVQTTFGYQYDVAFIDDTVRY